MIKRIFQIKSQSIHASAVLLFLRLAMGIAFMYHGWGKIQTPFGWMPPEAPVQIAGIFQFLAALSEFGGGTALIIGLVTPLASFGVGFTMLVATFTQIFVFKAPFVNPTGGNSYEFALIYLCITLLFFVLGPGKFSLDRLMFGERKS